MYIDQREGGVRGVRQTAQRGQMIVQCRQRNSLLRPTDGVAVPNDGPLTTSGSAPVCPATCTRRPGIGHYEPSAAPWHQPIRSLCSTSAHHWPPTCTHEQHIVHGEPTILHPRSTSRPRRPPNRSAWPRPSRRCVPRIVHAGPNHRSPCSIDRSGPTRPVDTKGQHVARCDTRGEPNFQRCGRSLGATVATSSVEPPARNARYTPMATIAIATSIKSLWLRTIVRVATITSASSTVLWGGDDMVDRY